MTPKNSSKKVPKKNFYFWKNFLNLLFLCNFRRSKRKKQKKNYLNIITGSKVMKIQKIWKKSKTLNFDFEPYKIFPKKNSIIKEGWFFSNSNVLYTMVVSKIKNSKVAPFLLLMHLTNNFSIFLYKLKKKLCSSRKLLNN